MTSCNKHIPYIHNLKPRMWVYTHSSANVLISKQSYWTVSRIIYHCVMWVTLLLRFWGATEEFLQLITNSIKSVDNGHVLWTLTTKLDERQREKMASSPPVVWQVATEFKASNTCGGYLHPAAAPDAWRCRWSWAGNSSPFGRSSAALDSPGWTWVSPSPLSPQPWLLIKQ